LQQDFEDAWEPDDATQAMVVKTLVNLTWEKVQLQVWEKARQELPKWIAQERSHAQQHRELYQRGTERTE
jgi:hypothetical protein